MNVVHVVDNMNEIPKDTPPGTIPGHLKFEYLEYVPDDGRPALIRMHYTYFPPPKKVEP